MCLTTARRDTEPVLGAWKPVTAVEAARAAAIR